MGRNIIIVRQFAMHFALQHFKVLLLAMESESFLNIFLVKQSDKFNWQILKKSQSSISLLLLLHFQTNWIKFLSNGISVEKKSLIKLDKLELNRFWLVSNDGKLRNCLFTDHMHAKSLCFLAGKTTLRIFFEGDFHFSSPFCKFSYFK